ncbi:hypothetical protein DPMN_032140 [Dreissena polymorpha]|uniref:Uncharacterized protein n=1 Tax=Dreissena polymorpha TaxID=45954 RepID=A0A9D4M1A3_DREPO|nr:hypothetical protein DPMN_032140 [Dreissena polymorpha]
MTQIQTQPKFIKINILTKFHKDCIEIVTSTKTDFKNKAYIENYPNHPGSHENASYIHIEKTAPSTGGHFFLLITTIFKLIRHINKTNVLTKFHDDWPKNMTRKSAPSPGGHVFSLITTIFKLLRDIRITNEINVTSREKDPRPHGGHETNLLTKFHEDWAKNVSSTLFTCFHYIHIEKTAPRPDSHVFSPIMTAKNVTSRVFTSIFYYIEIRKKTPPPLGGVVFLLIQTIFELNRCIQETNVITKFREDSTKNVTSREFTYFHHIHLEKTAPPSGGHVFSPIWTIFELFHDDWAKILTSRVFTRNTAPPHDGHVFQWTGTIFELNQHIIKKTILTKLHEDWASNVTSTHDHVSNSVELSFEQMF